MLGGPSGASLLAVGGFRQLRILGRRRRSRARGSAGICWMTGAAGAALTP